MRPLLFVSFGAGDMLESLPEHRNDFHPQTRRRRVLTRIGWFIYHLATTLAMIVGLVVGLSLLDPYTSWPIELVISVLLVVVFIALAKYLRVRAKPWFALSMGVGIGFFAIQGSLEHSGLGS